MIQWLDFSGDVDLSKYVLSNFAQSYGQLQQDLVANWNAQKIQVNRATSFFVEFGATDGITLSNSHLLEKTFGWDGILCEPAVSWHADLKSNRNCQIDTRCVYSMTGTKVQFSDVTNGELSSISDYASGDKWLEERKNAVQYEVETISLQDLLVQHQAPKTIHYLSIDTEGSEFDIIKEFDFNLWDIKFISIEHNYTENREKINKVLESFGYIRKYTEVSLWDDWYFKYN
jgi:FkbM family methyltransferase